MRPAEYREQFGLNTEMAPISPALQQKLVSTHREHLARTRPKESVFASYSLVGEVSWLARFADPESHAVVCDFGRPDSLLK